jgi:endonuclease YncB( thermonuclease family)
MAQILSKEIPIPVPVFHAQMTSCYDGDTAKFRLMRNFGDESQKTLRLLEVNCAEMKSKDPAVKEAAHKAHDFALRWFAEGALGLTTAGDIWPFVVQASDIQEKYGRVLGYAFRKSDGDCLNMALIREGHSEHIPLLVHLQRLRAREG